MNLGEKIKQLRETNNLSKEKFAKECELSINKINCFENGSEEPTIEEVKKISQVLGVTLDELLDNNIKYIIYKKESNVEKLAGLKLTIIKTIFYLFAWSLIIFFFLFMIIDGTSS